MKLSFIMVNKRNLGLLLGMLAAVALTAAAMIASSGGAG